MAAVELATAYVSLVPSAKGIAAGLATELGAPVEKAAAESAEKAGSSFASSFAKAGKLAGAGLAVGVTAAVAVGGALFKLGSDFDEANDKIAVATGATGEHLSALDKSFKNVFKSIPTSMGDASTAIGSLNTKLGLSGKPLEALSTQVLELSRVTGTDLKGNVDAAAAVFNNWGISAKNQGARLDDLYRASQATGVSVADLAGTMAKSGSILRQAGLNFDSSAALIGLLGKAGIDAGAVMPALSKSIATAAKAGKSAAVVFRETFDAIKSAPTATAAAAAAIDVFGAKAGPNLAGLIRQGKLSYEDLAKTIASGNETIVGSAKSTNDFGENLKILTNTLAVDLAPIAAKVFGGVNELLLLTTKVVQDDLAPAFDQYVKPIFTWLSDHMDIVKPALIGIAVVIGVPLVAAFIAWAVSAAASAAATLLALAPIIAIGIAIAALVAGFIYAYQHFDLFREAVDKIVDAIKLYFLVYFDLAKIAIATLIDYVKMIIRVVTDVVQGIQAIFRGDWKTAWDKFSDIPKAVIEFIMGRIQALLDFVGTIGGKISKLTAGMWDGIKEAFKTALNWVISAWNRTEFKIRGVDVGPIHFGGFTLGVPDIPLLAAGGIVNSPTLAMIGERGPEAVVPLGNRYAPGGGGGMTVNLTVNAGMGADGFRVGQQVVRAIQEFERNAGAEWRRPVSA